MIVQEFIDELSRRLRDVKKKQWDDEFLISALNAAIGALCTVLPQAFTVNRNLRLVAGVEQTIDQDLHRIVTLLHNVSNVDGSPRRAITKADMSAFDAAYPHWRQDAPRSYIRHWMNDEYDESKFYVWPPAAFVRGEEPVVPPLPVNPGALSSGYPRAGSQDSLEPYPVKGPYSVTDNTAERAQETDRAWWKLATDDVVANNDLYIVDFSDFVQLSPNNDDASVFLKVRDGGLGSLININYHYRDQISPFYPSGTGTYYLTVRDILAAVADGRPFLMINSYNNGTTTRCVSGFVASVDDMPRYVQITGAIDTDTSLAGFNADVSAIPDFGALAAGFMNRIDANLSNNLYSAVIREAMYDGIGTLPEFSYIRLRGDNSNISNADSTLSGGQIIIENGDQSASLVYNMYFDNPVTEIGFSLSAPTVYMSNSGGHVWMIVRQPTDTEPGIAYYRTREFSNMPLYDHATPELDEYIDANTVTQETVDQYQADILAYNEAFAAYNNWLNGSPAHIVRGTFTYTPHISAIEPPVLIPEPVAPVDPGGTPEQQAQYQQLLAEYNNQYAQHLDSVAQLEAYNARVDLVRVTDDVPIKRPHFQALQEFAMYYAYSVDDDLTANSGRAQRHWLAFFQMLNKREDSNLRLSESTETTE